MGHSSRQAADWKGQEVPVYGRKMPLGLVVGGKLYHGSPHELAKGTLLVPGGATKNYDQSKGKGVSITSNLGTAGHWGSLEGKVTGYVYEVDPLGEVEAWRVKPANRGESFILYEGIVPKARVLRLVKTVAPRRAGGRDKLGSSIQKLECRARLDLSEDPLKDRLEGLAKKDPGYLILREKLLDLGGERYVPQPEPDLRILLSRGHVMRGPVKMMKGRPISCHENVAYMVEDGIGIQAATGYALSLDGLWRQHSWGVMEDGTLIETTVRRKIYWGVILRGEEATTFCDFNLHRRASRVGARTMKRNIEGHMDKLGDSLRKLEAMGPQEQGLAEETLFRDVRERLPTQVLDPFQGAARGTALRAKRAGLSKIEAAADKVVQRLVGAELAIHQLHKATASGSKRRANSMSELDEAYSDDNPEFQALLKAGENYNQSVRDVKKALKVWAKKHHNLPSVVRWAREIGDTVNEIFWG